MLIGLLDNICVGVIWLYRRTGDGVCYWHLYGLAFSSEVVKSVVFTDAVPNKLLVRVSFGNRSLLLHGFCPGILFYLTNLAFYAFSDLLLTLVFTFYGILVLLHIIEIIRRLLRFASELELS